MSAYVVSSEYRTIRHNMTTFTGTNAKTNTTTVQLSLLLIPSLLYYHYYYCITWVRAPSSAFIAALKIHCSPSPHSSAARSPKSCTCAWMWRIRSVTMKPGWRELAVIPEPRALARWESSLVNRIFASLLWPYAALSMMVYRRENVIIIINIYIYIYIW